MIRARILLLPLALLFLCSCRAYSHYRFRPAVHDVELRDASEAVLAHVLVSPRRITVAEDGTPAMSFLIRVDNHSDQGIYLLPEELSLVDARLTSFQPPRVTREGEAPAPGDEPGEGSSEQPFLVSFPFPAGQRPRHLDLSALRLRLGLKHGEEVLTASASFERYDPWAERYDRPFDSWGPRWHWSVGVGWRYCY